MCKYPVGLKVGLHANCQKSFLCHAGGPRVAHNQTLEQEKKASTPIGSPKQARSSLVSPASRSSVRVTFGRPKNNQLKDRLRADQTRSYNPVWSP